jgi:protein-S-isoprenylcysteine O-methyltransferase Ste14
MRGTATFIYGVLAYAAGFVALLYLIGFAGNVLVPTSVDVGRPAPWSQALAVDALLLGAFALQHSVMARAAFKRRWTRIVPRAAERSTYVLVTSLVLALLFWQWRPLGTPVVWQVESTLAVQSLWAIYGLGWALVLLSTFLIDHFELFGLRQVFARLTGREMRPPEFRTPLLYRYVRHPLYLGLVLSLWSVPRMTAGHALFSFGLTCYILVGIAFEERDLVAHFGDRYRRYRTEVGMLVPRRSRT